MKDVLGSSVTGALLAWLLTTSSVLAQNTRNVTENIISLGSASWSFADYSDSGNWNHICRTRLFWYTIYNPLNQLKGDSCVNSVRRILGYAPLQDNNTLYPKAPPSQNLYNYWNL